MTMHYKNEGKRRMERPHTDLWKEYDYRTVANERRRKCMIEPQPEPKEYESIYVGEKKFTIPKFEKYEDLVKFLYELVEKEGK
ncbi:MAG: hypothetical protein PHW96_04675 [Candidatus Nanoarchaeia archaeon]|nr:hypothetical protein [Candidatus Nanoarchaeia archaeon]